MIAFLSSWEIATAVWLLILLIAALCLKVFREGLFAILKALFMRQLLRWVLLMVSYNVFIVLALLALGIWTLADLRGAFLWVVTAAFFMVYKVVNDRPKPGGLLLKIYEQGLALSVFVEFILNWVYVPLVLALIIVPVIGLFSLLAVPSETDGKNERAVRELSDRVLAAIGLSVLGYSLVYTGLNWNHFWSIETLREFLRPIVLTTLFLPFLWALLTYLAYEMAWRRLKFMKPEGTSTRKFMVKIFWTFGFRYNQVENWSLYLVRHRPSSYAELDRSLEDSQNRRDTETSQI